MVRGSVENAPTWREISPLLVFGVYVNNRRREEKFEQKVTKKAKGRRLIPYCHARLLHKKS
jgi:hypothetical protein